MSTALLILVTIASVISVMAAIIWILKLRRQLSENTRNAAQLAPTLRQLETERDIAIAARDKTNEILASVIDGIVALDFNKNVILLNKAAQELTGYSETEIQGRPIDRMIRLFSEQEEILPKTYCQGSFNKPVKVVGKEGKQTKVNLMTTQAEGSVQTNLGCILILHDLSKEEELEQMKLDFVSMASHELKTPLTSIIGYLSVFLDEAGNKLPKENLDLLDKAFVSAKQLQTLIQNLLNVNKIERERLDVEVEPINLNDNFGKAIEDLQNQAKLKNISLNFSRDDTLPKVLADPVRIGEVINNLVANAINYTSAGGKITVYMKASPNEVTTTVEDTGMGISQEAIPHLFSKFFRVSNSMQKGNKGTGLGLYISKSIIQKLNGKIWVESEVGKGSKFHFSLPVAIQDTSSLDRNKFVSEAIQTGALNY
ncbi:TPA: hypothetical protein DD690_04910 [Candidatus Daviesbacteria bacterium]|nr:MAG: Multi-sensor signal transduction histidine kinase [Candidatus Daviesbacteria bacterium GW2011_GWA2_38_17]OGE26819.1 MAG: hypothetical protein A3D02_03860 [Candidatus Daviesbacteria bacterium RIFCSPHIGHO2_02_FULL_39_41]OGE44973.1 MAG: hypothetical protein A3E67_02310 [Candidatus Daviesbacteria bacterium RIFCSPHIGHO2_12_FULL_38_25]OGE68446.1 MAG: hypothetical protein A3H81_05820 [Candidatus Daviesbacteria bacterium RIFCSPLOWO2_02_FULL_38_18]OGE71942.1 MAG: hypothetical protein A3H18_04100